MNLRVNALKNVSSNWFGVGTTTAVGFFLSPFILHRLGDEGFGLWVLIFSFTGYYGIFDFGIRSSIVKYVAQFEATGEHEQLTRVVNVSLFSYTCVALGLLVATGFCAVYVDSLFHIAPASLHTARLLVLVAGSTVALGFPLSVFSGILEGLQKFYFINLTQVVSTLLRAVLIVLALTHGFGLVTIVAITVVLPGLCSLACAWEGLRSLPLQFGARYVDWGTFRKIGNYSFFTFIAGLAWRLRFQSDAIIIGTMLSASAITYFSIGAKLVTYSLAPVNGLTEIFTPMASHFDAKGDRRRLLQLFVQGNRACAFLLFPIGATLLVMGKPLIHAWVGARYEWSYVILVILLVPTILSYIQTSSRQLLYGIGRHQVLAIVNVSEGLVNVILSIVLIRYWGIVGDALGTALPLLCTAVFFWPLYMCRLLEVPLNAFLKDAYLAPLALTAPLLALLLFLRRLSYPNHYAQLAAELAAGGVVYGLGLLWLFLTREPLGAAWRVRFRQYVQQAFGRS